MIRGLIALLVDPHCGDFSADAFDNEPSCYFAMCIFEVAAVEVNS